jgi:hypothetical protein
MIDVHSSLYSQLLLIILYSIVLQILNQGNTFQSILNNLQDWVHASRY